MKKKILKFILVGVSLYIAVLVIEFCCLYAAYGDNVWNYLNEFWSWYKTLFF